MRVITYGTFDLIHSGHIRLLERAAALGAELIVAVSTDEFNAQKKNKECAQCYEERKEIVSALRCVSKVIPESSWDQKSSDIVDNDIDIFVIGDDWEGKFDFLSEYCEVVYLSRTRGISTTERKKQLKDDLPVVKAEHAA